MLRPTRQEVLRMKLDDLRLLVQAQMGLENWSGDWPVAGIILEQSYFNFQRSSSGELLFGITLFGDRANGTGIDENALVAIFRAFALMHLENEELGRI